MHKKSDHRVHPVASVQMRSRGCGPWPQVLAPQTWRPDFSDEP